MPRKQKKYHYIYKTICIITSKYYIGMHSTNIIEDGYLGSGRRLRYSINKYGSENHFREILEFVNTRKELIQRETEVVNLNEIAKEDCMNLMVGGSGGFISKEQQKHRSICGGKAFAKKIKTDVEFAKKHSKRASLLLTKTHKKGLIPLNSFKGKTHSEETKIKMSKAKKGKGIGKQNSQFGTCWITKKGKNKKIKKIELKSFEEKNWIRGRNLSN